MRQINLSPFTTYKDQYRLLFWVRTVGSIHLSRCVISAVSAHLSEFFFGCSLGHKLILGIAPSFGLVPGSCSVKSSRLRARLRCTVCHGCSVSISSLCWNTGWQTNLSRYLKLYIAPSHNFIRSLFVFPF